MDVDLRKDVARRAVGVCADGTRRSTSTRPEKEEERGW